MVWACTLKKWQNPEESAFTVGERFSLNCQKTAVAQNKTAPPSQMDSANTSSQDSAQAGELATKSAWVSPDPLKLRLLHARPVDQNTWELTATSIVVGEHKIEGLRYGDELAQTFSFQVKSVQDPQNPVSSPFGPIYVQWAKPPSDLWFFLLLGLILLIFTGVRRAWLVYRRRRRWRQFSASVRGEQSPWDELCEALFQWRKKLQETEFVAHQQNSSAASGAMIPLSSILLRYLGRQENLPLTAMSSREVQKILLRWRERSEGPWLQVYTFWEESERLKSTSEKEDIQFLLDWLSELSAELQKWYQLRTHLQGEKL